MADLYRVECELTGFAGAPGFNTWFFSAVTQDAATADAITTALDTFYTAVRTFLQDDVIVTVPNDLLVIDDSDGQPQAIQGGTAGPASIAGNGPEDLAHFTQAKLQLRTGTFVDGRELRGGPFLGPWGGTISAEGNIGTTAQTTITSALDTLRAGIGLAGAPLVIWRRPKPATETEPAVPGTNAAVTTVGVWNRPAVQRRRRD